LESAFFGAATLVAALFVFTLKGDFYVKNESHRCAKKFDEEYVEYLGYGTFASSHCVSFLNNKKQRKKEKRKWMKKS
jgi:hypothetical protein